MKTKYITVYLIELLDEIYYIDKCESEHPNTTEFAHGRMTVKQFRDYNYSIERLRLVQSTRR
jgi:hypothetical protein